MNKNILEVKNLKVEYKTSGINGGKTVKAINDVSFSLIEGETFAIAGESGCGKSTLAKAIMKLVPVKSGEIFFGGTDITKLSDYVKNVQMVFQNPYSSLNPKMTIGKILKEPLDINTNLNKKMKQEKIENILAKVGLNLSHLDLYPHEFSGGQRQRIAIARALMLEPQIIIADEPVSALDASIQAQILNMLNDLKREFKLTILFISHDLSVIRFLADKVSVMYLGEFVETGTKDEIFNAAAHPYTKALLNAIPSYGKEHSELLPGDIPIELPEGCKFMSRCKFAKDECNFACPKFTDLSSTHRVRCVL